jgi:hypothetical protein
MSMMRWAGHVREGRGVYRVLVGKLRERDHCGDPGLDPGVDGRIILRWIFTKWGVGYGVWTGLRWLRMETGGRHL